MLSAEEKHRIHRALEEAGGDRNAAAVALGIDSLKLKDTIHACPELRERWAESHEPQEALGSDQVLAREELLPPGQIPEPVLKSEAEMAAALKKEEKKLLSVGLKGLGLTRDEIEIAESCSRFTHQHLGSVMGIMTGGAVRLGVQLQTRIVALVERLEEGFGGDEALEEEKMVLEYLDRFMTTYIRYFGKIQEAAFLQAKIEDLRRQRAEGKAQGKRKPGFAPMVAVSVTGSEKVEFKGGK